MIPRSYPSVYDTFNGQTKMVVFVLSSVSGLTKWIDYIPVKEIAAPTKLNSYNNDDAMSVSPLASTTGKQAWIDYIPVYLVTTGTAWSSNNDGYIPVNGSGGVVAVDNLLLENGDNLLLESGDLILLES
jgi:hypothetical protein